MESWGKISKGPFNQTYQGPYPPTSPRPPPVGIPLKQSDEVLHAEICLPQYGAQRASIQLAMCGYHCLSERFIPPQDDVTSVLSAHSEAHALQGGHYLLP
jgi:hypothetical protein